MKLALLKKLNGTTWYHVSGGTNSKSDLPNNDECYEKG